MEKQIIRSRRKTYGLEIKDGKLIVRVPMEAEPQQIELFLERHRRWIEKRLNLSEQRQEELKAVVPLSLQEQRQLAERAVEYIPQRVQYYAPLVGVHYRKIRISKMLTRWGSCSTNGNLSFNVLLMLAPPEVLDSIVVHELCHLRQPNHSKAFYAEVLRVFPRYYECDRWLKDNSGILMKKGGYYRE